MENINLSTLGDQYTVIIFVNNSYAFPCYHRQITLHRHRQLSISTIGINQSSSLDLVIFCCFIIGTITHRQLPCHPAITRLCADPRFINFSDTCPKAVSTHAPQFPIIKSLMLQNSL